MISFISFISHFIFSFIFQSLLLFSLRTVSPISSSRVASCFKPEHAGRLG
ncbi:hypothetical protein OROGR_006343 [Orobanche gracilis]